MDMGAPPRVRAAFGTWWVPGSTLHLPCPGHPAQQTCCTLADPAAWSRARAASMGLWNPCTSRGLKAVRRGGMESTGEGSRRGARGEQERKNTPHCPSHRAPSSSSTLPERSVHFQWMNCSPCTCSYQLQYILNLTCIIYLYIQQRNTFFSSLRAGAAALEREAGLAGEALQPG